MNTPAPQTVLEVLIAARKLIEDPARWTTGAMARLANGETADVQNPAATCFCIYGAITAVCGGNNDLRNRAMNALRHLCPDGSPVDLNDNEGHAAILSVLDQVIQVGI